MKKFDQAELVLALVVAEFYPIHALTYEVQT